MNIEFIIFNNVYLYCLWFYYKLFYYKFLNFITLQNVRLVCSRGPIMKQISSFSKHK